MNTTGNIFDKALLQTLLDTNCWKIVCSQLPPETEQIFSSKHDKWLKRNIDKHLHREIMFALKGNSISSLNGKSYHCTPGSIFLFDEFEEHDRSYSLANEDLTHLWLYLVEGMIVISVVIIKNHRFDNLRRVLIIRDENLVSLLIDAWDSLKCNTQPNILKRNRLVAAISLCMAQLAEYDLNGDNKVQNEKYYQIQTINIIKEYINTTTGKNLTLEGLAQIAGYSKFHFLRLFKQYTGESVHRYINTVRVAKVKSMLKKGYRKKEISIELGFSGASAFSRWYRKNMTN